MQRLSLLVATGALALSFVLAGDTALAIGTSSGLYGGENNNDRGEDVKKVRDTLKQPQEEVKQANDDSTALSATDKNTKVGNSVRRDLNSRIPIETQRENANTPENRAWAASYNNYNAAAKQTALYSQILNNDPTRPGESESDRKIRLMEQAEETVKQDQITAANAARDATAKGDNSVLAKQKAAENNDQVKADALGMSLADYLSKRHEVANPNTCIADPHAAGC